MKLKLTSGSQRDLRDISRYTLREFGPAQEEKYLSGLWSHFQQLKEFPRSGREVRAGGTLRISAYREHHLLYRQQGDDELRIEGAIHQARDLEAVVRRLRS
jgi:plasmid stabilization system protein ParE